MALPAPGNPISANMINVEASRTGTTNAPLSGTSSTPQAGSLVKLYAPPNSDVNQPAPHAYSEFYSKSWSGGVSVTSYTSSSTNVTAVSACQDTIDQTYYHDGSGTWPVYGDRCFYNDPGITPLATGYYRTGEFTNTSGGGVYVGTNPVTGDLGYVVGINGGVFSCLTNSYYQKYYYGTTTPFASVFDACGSSAWASSSTFNFYYSGTLGNGTVCFDSNAGTVLEFPSAVTTPLSLKSLNTGAPTHTCNINSSSEITNYASCPTLTAFSASPETSGASACSQTIPSNNFYHTGINDYPEQGDWVFQNNNNYQPVLTTGSQWFKAFTSPNAYAFRLQNATPGPGYVNSDLVCI